MGTKFNSLDNHIQDHIGQLRATSGLPEGDESLEALAAAWTEKKEAFEALVERNGMAVVGSFATTDNQGALVMTWSGSLLNIGPLVEGERACAYASIGLRRDVPESAREPQSRLEGDLETDAPASFSRGPVKKTSPILKIAQFRKQLPARIETAQLAEVTRIITEEFVEVNKTIIQ